MVDNNEAKPYTVTTAMNLSNYRNFLEMEKLRLEYRSAISTVRPTIISEIADEIRSDLPYLARFMVAKNIALEDRDIVAAELVKIKLLGLEEMPEAVWIAYHAAKGFLNDNK
jgi:hypothetical protein